MTERPQRNPQDDPTSPCRAIQPGAVVSIARVTEGLDVIQPLGVGRLLAALTVGERPQLQLDAEAAFSPSRLEAIHRVDGASARIRTKFSLYELRLVEAELSAAGFDTGPVPLPESPDESTRVVRLEIEPAAPGGARLREGSGVRVSRRETADGTTRSLGSGVLLADPEAGEALRIATDDGVLASSPVVAVRTTATGSLHVETARATYVLETSEPD